MHDLSPTRFLLPIVMFALPASDHFHCVHGREIAYHICKILFYFASRKNKISVPFPFRVSLQKFIKQRIRINQPLFACRLFTNIHCYASCFIKSSLCVNAHLLHTRMRIYLFSDSGFVLTIFAVYFTDLFVRQNQHRLCSLRSDSGMILILPFPTFILLYPIVH